MPFIYFVFKRDSKRPDKRNCDYWLVEPSQICPVCPPLKMALSLIPLLKQIAELCFCEIFSHTFARKNLNWKKKIQFHPLWSTQKWEETAFLQCLSIFFILSCVNSAFTRRKRPSLIFSFSFHIITTPLKNSFQKKQHRPSAHGATTEICSHQLGTGRVGTILPKWWR